MKFSYNWISDMVKDLDVPPVEIGRLITMKTAECEGVERTGEWFEAVCAANILKAEPMDETHLTLALVDAGTYGKRQVVCGAPNCVQGMTTAYVPAGTALEGKAIRKTEIRGFESDGMLASAAELGISRDRDGILDLSHASLKGCRADTIVEIDNKSLTHRPDLWGHYGMAREVAAITGLELLDPVNLSTLPDAKPYTEIAIHDFQLAPRYSALLLENVTVEASPLWMQQRLTALGLNPINNVVDVTNFVMAELAQPMHAFDAEKLHGHKITVRPALDGEVCEALNGVVYTLDSSTLVIADSEGPVAIAGVIGGAASAITAATRRVLIESANFNAASVRKTSSKLRLRTDASMRFEKSQDPENTVRALARAVELLKEIAPAIRIVGGVADLYRPLPKPEPITFSLDWMQRKLGRDIESVEVHSILTSLDFGVDTAGECFSVTVPSWRATKDIGIKDDLVEEVGRMIGYGSIIPVAPLIASRVPPFDAQRAYHRKLREQLTEQGYTEVYNYSFVSEAQAGAFDLPIADQIRVLNPIAAGQEYLRSSLLPHLRRNIVDNSREFDHFRLFEIGREIHRRGGELPGEIPHLAAVVCAKDDGRSGLFELKRLAGTLLDGCLVVPAEPRPYEHPARAAEIIWREQSVGRLFELHPKIVETGRAAVLYVNLQRTFAAQPELVRYQPLRRFPTSAFDLSVITDTRELSGNVLRAIQAFGGPNLVSAGYLYEYAGEAIGDGRKSITFRVTAGAMDRTLTSEEVAAIREAIIAGLASAGYKLQCVGSA